MKVLHIIMKNVFSFVGSMLGWVMFAVMLIIVGNMVQDEKIAMEYISELESVIEADGSCVADYCDKCLDYHNIFGD